MLNLELNQKQIITQKMIQSANILQMNAQELSDYVKELALENPVVDFAENEEGSKSGMTPEDEERIKKLEWLASLDEQNRTFYQFDRDALEADSGYYNLAGSGGETLADSLHLQLLGKGYTQQEQRVFDYVIANLDSHGFFNIPTDEVARANQVSLSVAARCIHIMRNLDPYGVCAASVTDCLLKQLEMNPEADQIEERIVKEYLELLGRNQLAQIARALHCDISRVAKAAERIRALNPRPAQGFDNGELMRYVVPDVTVVKLEDRFEILLNNYTCPTIHVNKDYLSMLKSADDPEVKDYLLKKINQAEEVRDYISKRGSTLLRLVEVIVAVQKHFFMTGENSLRPLRMHEAAQMLECHESTVSRALNDKYLQCCWGVYPLSFFFPKGIGGQEDGDSLSVMKVKDMLLEEIKNEDKKSPLSDQKIADNLNARGVEISRRTVAKYREEMNIPNGRGRKQY